MLLNYKKEKMCSVRSNYFNPGNWHLVGPQLNERLDYERFGNCQLKAVRLPTAFCPMPPEHMSVSRWPPALSNFTSFSRVLRCAKRYLYNTLICLAQLQLLVHILWSSVLVWYCLRDLCKRRVLWGVRN